MAPSASYQLEVLIIDDGVREVDPLFWDRILRRLFHMARVATLLSFKSGFSFSLKNTNEPEFILGGIDHSLVGDEAEMRWFPIKKQRL